MGGTLDLFNYSINSVPFAPRISLSYRLNDTLNALISAGRYYQVPSYTWMATPNKKLDKIIADQLISSLKYFPLNDWKLQVELFYKKMTIIYLDIREEIQFLIINGYTTIHNNILCNL